MKARNVIADYECEMMQYTGDNYSKIINMIRKYRNLSIRHIIPNIHVYGLRFPEEKTVISPTNWMVNKKGRIMVCSNKIKESNFEIIE